MNDPNNMPIVVHPSPTSSNLQTTGDFSEDLVKKSTQMHIEDVQRGLGVVASMLLNRGAWHDHTKLMHLEEFTKYLNAYKQTGKFPESEGNWYNKYHLTERHHLDDGAPEDVSLIDVLDSIVDGVVSGMARSGSYEVRPLPAELLAKAYVNTAKLIHSLVRVENTTTPEAPPSSATGFKFKVDPEP